jgi:hypothetical protein
MLRIFSSIGVVVILLPTSFAQSAQPLTAPDDVVLQFETEGNSREFHLGELIPIKYSYSAMTPGRYLRVTPPGKLDGGRGLEIWCSPSGESVAPHPPSRDNVTLLKMLTAPCGGFGGGVGGSCFDCVGDHPLTTAPLSFGGIPLNTYVRFRSAGTYTCEASSADVTTASRDEKLRPALWVKSGPVVLTIVNDPAWAHAAAVAYGDAYEKLCRGDDVPHHSFLQCGDVARRITYLDTADSLVEEVKLFDGRNHGWENGFWEAIQDSSQPEAAFRLVEARMVDPDFQVSTWIIEWLASAELRLEAPDAFQSGEPATYHAQSVEALRRYVRLLGSSLSRKEPAVMLESEKTYLTFARQEYCEKEPLIPTDEQLRIMADLPH